LSGKTVAENKYFKSEYSRIPAITICLPIFFSMDKFADFYLKDSNNSDYKNLYQDYRKFIESIDQKFMRNGNDVKNEKYFHKMNKIYIKDFNSFERIRNISINKMFELGPDKLTIKTAAAKLLNEQGKVIPRFIRHPNQIQSFIALKQTRKCFTLFSDYDEYYRDNKYNLVHIFGDQIEQGVLMRQCQGDK